MGFIELDEFMTLMVVTIIEVTTHFLLISTDFEKILENL